MQRFQHQLRGENPAPRARLCPVTAGPPCCVCYPHRAAPRAALPRAGPQPIPSYRLRWGALGSPAPYGVRAVEGAAFSLVRKGGGTRTGRVGPCSLLSHAVLRCLASVTKLQLKFLTRSQQLVPWVLAGAAALRRAEVGLCTAVALQCSGRSGEHSPGAAQ